jgi:hypothetical protein
MTPTDRSNERMNDEVHKSIRNKHFVKVDVFRSHVKAVMELKEFEGKNENANI